jgi:hypothetical protein
MIFKFILSVVGLIQELTDLESSIESLENIKILVDLLVR